MKAIRKHRTKWQSLGIVSLVTFSLAVIVLLLGMLFDYPKGIFRKVEHGTEVRHTPTSPRVAIDDTPPTKSTPPEPAPIIPDDHIPPITNGLAPVITSFTTTQPVVFLTIDDGAHKTPDELQALTKNHIKATLFLSRLFIADNPDFFKDFQAAGYPIEDHSLDHLIDAPSIQSYATQKAQICGMADYEEQHYGRRPFFFRPPGGSYSPAMRQAAAECGMKAIVTWIAKANGGSMQYQIGDHLRPGDIVLMHFRPEFQQDFQAFLDAANAQHLRTELLQDWL